MRFTLKSDNCELHLEPIVDSHYYCAFCDVEAIAVFRLRFENLEALYTSFLNLPNSFDLKLCEKCKGWAERAFREAK